MRCGRQRLRRAGAAIGVWLIAGCAWQCIYPPDPPRADAGAEGESSDAGPDGNGAPDGGVPDAGVPDAGVPDAGVPDAGVPDAGAPDAGAPDAGAPDAGARRIVIPGAAGWTFHGPSSGAPGEVWGVSSDAAGNLWVAGGSEGLFVLRPGASRFERFTIADGLTPCRDPSGDLAQRVMSVAGGAAGEVYVGYEGRFDGPEEDDATYLVKSGDADRVQLTDGGILVQHLDISTPPGMYDNPYLVNGREKIRTVWRILRDPSSGDVWFGGNHGVAILEAGNGTVYEHQHATINACQPNGHCTMLSGDWFGIVLDAAGDLWMGGGHRLARLQYSTPHGFWAPISPILDVWPDTSETRRNDDFVQDLTMIDDTLWVGSILNGLASIDADGVVHALELPGYQGRVTALEGDPEDGSLWVGLQWGGVLHLAGGTLAIHGESIFGGTLIDWPVWDIQSDWHGPGGTRRMLFAFRGGAVGIYTGR